MLKDVDIKKSQISLLIFAVGPGALDWLKSPVTKYFILVTSLYSHDIILVLF